MIAERQQTLCTICCGALPYIPHCARSMDHTIHESQQLDLLFDHMLQSRLDSNAAAAAGRAVGLGVSMSEDASIRRRNSSVDPACSSEKYADQSGYCSETNINWIGKHSLLSSSSSPSSSSLLSSSSLSSSVIITTTIIIAINAIIITDRLQRFSIQPCSGVRPIVRYACFRFTAVSQLQRRLAGLSAAAASIGEMCC
jgi:hypothetical protein